MLRGAGAMGGVADLWSKACTVWLGNIPSDHTEETLRAAFENYGPVDEVSLQRNDEDFHSLAMVTFHKAEVAAGLLNKGDYVVLQSDGGSARLKIRGVSKPMQPEGALDKHIRYEDIVGVIQTFEDNDGPFWYELCFRYSEEKPVKRWVQAHHVDNRAIKDRSLLQSAHQAKLFGKDATGKSNRKSTPKNKERAPEPEPEVVVEEEKPSQGGIAKRGGKEWRELLCHGLEMSATERGSGTARGISIELMAWGGGYSGQLGVPLPGKKSSNTARVVTFDEGDEPRHVACGGSFSAVVTSSGKVYTWGMGKRGQLGYEVTAVSGQQPLPKQVTSISQTPIMSIACGREHTLVLGFDGVIHSWGCNKFGQLGHGDHQTRTNPFKVSSKNTQGLVLGFRSISAGDNHSAALCVGGRLYTWGSGSYGQLGHGEPQKRDEPTLRPKLVEIPAKDGVPTRCRHLTCGSVITAVISQQNRLLVCGSAEKYAPGGDKSATCAFLFTPTEMPLKQRVKSVACGKSHLMMLTEDGDVYTVGAGKAGQLGHGRCSDLVRPRLVLYRKNIVHIATGRYHSMAITSHGSIYTWGSGEHGQLCHGVNGDTAIPKVVGSILHRAVLKTACGEHHTLALTTAPIEEDLAPDMVVWKFHEDEEYLLKRELASRSLAGVTKKHFREVESMTKKLIKDYKGVMKLKDGHPASPPPDAIDVEEDKEDRGAAGVPGGDGSQMPKSVQEMKADIEREVASSEEAFQVWCGAVGKRGKKAKEPLDFETEANSTQGTARSSDTAAGSVTLPELPSARASNREPKQPRGSARPTTPRKLPSHRKPGPSTETHMGAQSPLADDEDGMLIEIPRTQIYAQLQELQLAVKASVREVAAADPSREIGRLQKLLIKQRDSYSKCEAGRRARGAKLKRLTSDLDTLKYRDVNVADVAGMRKKSESIEVQLQAVQLKYEEEKENREVFDIVIMQLNEELNQQLHSIGDLRETQVENGVLLEKMTKRKHQAIEEMHDVQKEVTRMDKESKQLRDHLYEHLEGVMDLVTYMERTVNGVNHAATERKMRVENKQQRKLEKLQRKIQQKEKHAKSIRRTAAGAAFALGTWLEKKFQTITDATGLRVSDVEKIIDRIATRDAVMSDLHTNQKQKKDVLKVLSTQKKDAEAVLSVARAKFFSEKTLRQVDTIKKGIDSAASRGTYPKTKFLEATSCVASVYHLVFTLMRRLDAVENGGKASGTSATPLELWKSVENSAQNVAMCNQFLENFENRVGDCLQLVRPAAETPRGRESASTYRSTTTVEEEPVAALAN